ncbi:MAG TPA: hypothetical protein VM581_03805 [Magnetospirillaceae bacterium]|nr:hypothetical protein [Magnetospirillaceae bacterium]
MQLPTPAGTMAVLVESTDNLRDAVVKLVADVDYGTFLAVLTGSDEMLNIILKPGWDYDGWLVATK